MTKPSGKDGKFDVQFQLARLVRGDQLPDSSLCRRLCVVFAAVQPSAAAASWICATEAGEKRGNTPDGPDLVFSASVS